MYVLGIETSCDETAASVVKNGNIVLSNAVSSSIKYHNKYGGIVPEIASRMQLETMPQVVDSSIKAAGIKLKDLGLIAVTKGPGLLGSLLVGISFAKSLSLGLGIPLLGINHIHAHIYGSFLNRELIPRPFISLIVSGGHTSLFYVEDFDKIKLLGETLDDACGEAFDKVAKILGLGYPGGPIIDKLSRKGNPKKIIFKCSGTKKPLDFSFSGIKTAVLYYVKNNADVRCSMLDTRKRKSSIKDRGSRNKDLGFKIADIAASFQETVVDTLISKSLLACEIKKIDRMVVGGGVAANSKLRDKFIRQAAVNRIKVYFPPTDFCMDNAAMVAGFGYQLFKRGYRSDLGLSADLK